MTDLTVAIIQARMGSTRLPGKVLLPLQCSHVLAHDVIRVRAARTVDRVVLATSTAGADDAIAHFGEEFGVPVVRGSEANVQQRLHDAATAHDASTIVRITGDCPLIDPATIDAIVPHVSEGPAAYATNTIERTFPRGLDVEAFSAESFDRVLDRARTDREREHVTPYYRDNPAEFAVENVTSDAVFDTDRYQNRTDLRLTLDEADDYRLIRRVYEDLTEPWPSTTEDDRGPSDATTRSSTDPPPEMLDIRDVIDHIDEAGLAGINATVSQKEH